MTEVIRDIAEGRGQNALRRYVLDVLAYRVYKYSKESLRFGQIDLALGI